MRHPYLIAAGALGTLSVVLIAVSAGVFMERPTTLRVAVSSHDADDTAVLAAAGKLAKRGHHGFRLKLLPVDGVAGAAKAMDDHKADLSVVRADVATPDVGRTVVLLHKDVAVLVAPGGNEIERVADLGGKRLAILAGHDDDKALLDAILTQYDVDPASVTLVPLKPDEVEAALKDKRADALYAVGLATTPLMQTLTKAVGRAGEGPPAFLPVAEAAAMAERLPAYEAEEVARGTFGGAPPRPADDVGTLGVTTSLMASTDVSEGTIAELTRFLLSDRVALAEITPLARRIAAPSTDKGNALPVHPGAAAYIDDEEETFFDRYSDAIYIGAMVLGVLASGMAAVVSRVGTVGSVPVEEFIGRLMAIFRQVRAAGTPQALDTCEGEVDAIVEEALGASSLRGLDEKRVAALTMAVDQVREAIHDRRDALRRGLLGGPAAANDEAPPTLAAYPTILIGPGAERPPSAF